ncbi:MAG: hypothetical protein FWD28_10030 [Treponema sp.]|nr:hypothetical protein [Treponema sp.]
MYFHIKRLVVFTLFFTAFFAGFSLFSQNLREAKIFIPPVTGAAPEEDKAFFYEKLTYEVVLLYYGLAGSLRNSEYILKSSVIDVSEFTSNYEELSHIQRAGYSGPVPQRPIPPVRNTRDRREFFSWDIENSVQFFDTSSPEDNYQPSSPAGAGSPHSAQNQPRTRTGNRVLVMELIHTANENIVSGGYVFYNEGSASASFSIGTEFSIVVYNMLSGLPEIEEYRDWRNNWIYIEASALWMPRIYYNAGGSSINLANFGFRLAADIHLLDFLALSAGVQFTQDWIVVSGMGAGQNRDIILEIPVAVKLVFKPYDIFILEPYGGISYNISMQKVTQPSMLSWFAGFQFGFKLGPGLVFIDPRFSQDLYNSTLGTLTYQRSMAQVGIGYKFGILPKQPVVRHY